MAQQKIAILGSGGVGDALAAGFLARGHAVMRGTRDPSKLDAWKAGAAGARGSASVGSVAEATAFGELVVLAVKGTGAEAVVKAASAGLAGKVVIDTTNPIADEPPQAGVLRYFTGPNESLMERLQALAPAAKFVKAFNSVGAPYMVDPKFAAKPAMFLCGADAVAKQTVAGLVEAFGWKPVDMGGTEVARPIEALCQLWCAPGLGAGDWSPHAFGWL